MKFRQVIKKRGFTLVELIIVMVVIALLAGMAIPKFIGVQRDAKATNIINDCDVLETIGVQIETKRDVDAAVPDGAYGASAVKVVPSADLTAALATIGEDLSVAELYTIDAAKYEPLLGKSLKNEIADYAVLVGGDFEGKIVNVNGTENGDGDKVFGLDIPS